MGECILVVRKWQERQGPKSSRSQVSMELSGDGWPEKDAWSSLHSEPEPMLSVHKCRGSGCVHGRVDVRVASVGDICMTRHWKV